MERYSRGRNRAMTPKNIAPRAALREQLDGLEQEQPDAKKLGINRLDDRFLLGLNLIERPLAAP
jgi:hypothetical protein